MVSVSVTAKSAGALRTIGEAATELDIEPHVLRYWEKRFSQIKPVRRRGRRYYDPAAMKLLGTIRHLLRFEKYTIEGVQELLAKRGTLVAHTQNAGAARDLVAKAANTSQPAMAGALETVQGSGAARDDLQRSNNNASNAVTDESASAGKGLGVVGIGTGTELDAALDIEAFLAIRSVIVAMIAENDNVLSKVASSVR